MQNPSYTPANAQHIPDGWSFPTLSANVPPAPVVHVPVRGGGAASVTVTRVRWGRLLPLLAGVALLAFGAWTILGPSPATSSSASNASRTVSGGGSGEVEISDATGTGDDASAAAGAAPEAATPEAPAAVPAPTAAPRAAAPSARAGTPRRGAGRAARRGVAVAPVVRGGSSAAAATAPRARATGGGAPAGELPMTGIETWIAAILGVLLLGIGICVHVSAVRIGMTAMLYRRGILLRPTECARLATEHGLAPLRVRLSDLLHRLLEEPTRSPDFVSTRHAI